MVGRENGLIRDLDIAVQCRNIRLCCRVPNACNYRYDPCRRRYPIRQRPDPYSPGSRDIFDFACNIVYISYEPVQRFISENIRQSRRRHPGLFDGISNLEFCGIVNLRNAHRSKRFFKGHRLRKEIRADERFVHLLVVQSRKYRSVVQRQSSAGPGGHKFAFRQSRRENSRGNALTSRPSSG